jgi:formylglycine-generating enzyme required for sulfatase activity
MIGVGWTEAEELCSRLSAGPVRYRLPTEAEWEKAARGGLIDVPFAWGNEPPDETRCDFNRFDRVSILPSRRFAPNGYGLYAMCGGVWEWTCDWYDALYYGESAQDNPTGPPRGQARSIRGGSWADCADAVTVTFRMAHGNSDWKTGKWGAPRTPNIGFRICRSEIAQTGGPSDQKS